MVRDEIQHQLDIALGEPFAKLSQRRVTPDLVADRVGGNSKAGAAYIVLDEVGQEGAELGCAIRARSPRSRGLQGRFARRLKAKSSRSPAERSHRS